MSAATPGRIRGAARAASWVLVPAGIGIASRVYSILLIIWADRQRTDVIPNPFTMWDGLWYVSIAEHGYHPFPIAGGLRDIAFFPAWPTLMRFATPAGWYVRLVGPALANVLFVVACVLVWRVLSRRLGSDVATLGVALLAFSPAGYVGSLSYSEPLFLVFAASAFLLRGRTVPRMVAVAAAMATRIAGSALVLVALLDALAARGRDRARHLLVAAAGAAAFAAWWIFIAVLMGDPLGFLRGSPSWAGESGIRSFAQALTFAEVPQVVSLGLLGVWVAGALLVLRRDRELGVFALGVLALTLLPGGLVSSTPRYAMSAFPVFAGLALAARGRWSAVALVASALAQALFTYWVVVQDRAP